MIDLPNDRSKNSHKIKSNHWMTRFMTALPYNRNSGTDCGHKLRKHPEVIR